MATKFWGYSKNGNGWRSGPITCWLSFLFWLWVFLLSSRCARARKMKLRAMGVRSMLVLLLWITITRARSHTCTQPELGARTHAHAPTCVRGCAKYDNIIFSWSLSQFWLHSSTCLCCEMSCRKVKTNHWMCERVCACRRGCLWCVGEEKALWMVCKRCCKGEVRGYAENGRRKVGT